MSEYDSHKKELQELIKSRKLKMASPDDGGAGAAKEEYIPLKPTTFKEKWINYWYHYKGLTFGTLFAGILVFTFVWQIATRTVYDATMMIVSALPFDSVSESFEAKLSPIVNDYTKNGKIDLDVLPIQQDNEGKYEVSPEMVQANFVKLTASISGVETYIYMLDEGNYKALKEMEMQFMDLSELVSADKLGDTPDRYPLKDTKLAKLLDVEQATENMYLCFLDYDSMDEKRQQKKEIKANYERDLPFFKALLEYE